MAKHSLTIAWLAAMTAPALQAATPAAATVYTSRAAFSAVLGTHVFQDFETLVGTPAYPGNYGGGVGYAAPWLGGITVGALHFDGKDDPAGDGDFIIGPGSPAYSMGSFNLLGGKRRMVIDIAGGATAIGFDVGQPIGQWWGTGPLPFTIAVRPVGGTLAALASLVGAQGPNFFGYTGPRFDQLQITGGFAYYVYVDNVAFGSLRAAGAVPEPASWALLIAGFGLVGAAARRRRGFVAVAS